MSIRSGARRQMPHRSSPAVAPLFSRRELLRLMSMVTLLILIGMTIQQARLTEQNDNAPVATKSDQAFAETVIPGPNDTQAFEESEAKQQFLAVSDKSPLAAEEMPSYWRLMRWSRTQTFDQMSERAHRDRYFTHLGQAPEEHRGELIELKVSLRRSVSFKAPKNSAGVEVVYEAWGVTDESRGNFYCLVFSDKPPELPIHPDIHEEARFVGYFHKLVSYEDPMEKTRWAPVLIGRLQWRENAARVALQQSRHSWSYWLWGSLIGIGGLVVWTNRYLERGRELFDRSPETDHASIEQWLDNGLGEDHSSLENLPWLEDREKVDARSPESS
jgi:hypothetical protein